MEQKMAFKVGDRVCQPGLRFKQENNRYGVVVECYQGTRTTTGRGEELIAVRFDDGQLGRGYLNRRGFLIPEPLVVPTMWMPDAAKKTN
jgi:hypothetical protein